MYEMAVSGGMPEGMGCRQCDTLCRTLPMCCGAFLRARHWAMHPLSEDQRDRAAARARAEIETAAELYGCAGAAQAVLALVLAVAAAVNHLLN